MESHSYSGEDKLLAVICHVSAFFMPFLLPLIIYLVKKDSPFVRNHAKEALMFHIGMAVAEFISWLLAIILIGILLMPFFFIVYVVCTIIAVIRSINGEPYTYPVTTHLAQKF